MLSNRRMQPVWQLVNERIGTGHTQGGVNVFLRSGLVGNAQIFQNSARKQSQVLGHIGKQSPGQPAGRQGLSIGLELDEPVLGRVNAQQQQENGTLSATG